jgi:hypothetical protein
MAGLGSMAATKTVVQDRYGDLDVPQSRDQQAQNRVIGTCRGARDR